VIPAAVGFLQVSDFDNRRFVFHCQSNRDSNGFAIPLLLGDFDFWPILQLIRLHHHPVPAFAPLRISIIIAEGLSGKDNGLFHMIILKDKQGLLLSPFD